MSSEQQKQEGVNRVEQLIESADFTLQSEQSSKMQRLEQNRSILLKYVQDNIIGTWSDKYQLKTVYGSKPLVYADYTASGKSLKFIEDYIQNEILPMYANTHTQQSGTGKQTNNAREESRAIIKRVCGANEDDALIFVGNGTTSAVNLLVTKLRIREICEKVEKFKVNGDEQQDLKKEVNFCKQNRWGSYDCILCKTIMRSLGQYEQHAQTDFHKRHVEIFEQSQQVWSERPVIFMSIYEHNSNALPWREAGALIELIPLDDQCQLDFQAFEALLVKYKNYKSLKVAAISAGNNITGSLVDVDRLAVLCHKYGTLACFDYAAVVPYVPVNMQGVTPDLAQDCGFKPIEQKDWGLTYKDAVYFSPHKLIGGPQASGVLIAKKNILYSKKPARSGGGIVFYVDEQSHEYISNVEDLEEAGTPGVVQDIRAGLVFQLKESFGIKFIHDRETHINTLAMHRFQALGDKILLIGNNTLPKVSIYSFLIRAHVGAQGVKFLNPAFVVSLLNDLFGIQSRSGCLCASMFGQQMLGIDQKMSGEYKEALFDGNELLRLGYTRVNLNFFIPDEEIDYILSAIEFIANFGWMFLPHYQFEVETGIWVNREEKESRVRTWLGQIDYSFGMMSFRSHGTVSKHYPTSSFLKDPSLFKPLSQHLEEASQTLIQVLTNYKNLYGKSKDLNQLQLISESSRHLVWFILPCEVLPDLLSLKNTVLTMEMIREFNNSRRGESKQLISPFKPLEFDFKSGKMVKEESKKEDKEDESKEDNDGIEDDFSMMGIQQEVVQPTIVSTSTQQFKRPKKSSLIKVPKEILSQVGNAIRDFEMIKDGDRVLVALSGGKDSLALIHILRHFQAVAPIKFDLGAVTVDPMVYEYNPSPLIPYLRDEVQIPYFLERDAIVERAKTCMQKNSICAFCSRMKRGMIYNCARREGFNVIAMGQHLDDLAESFVMSAFHNGYLRTMKANYTIDKGDLRVIRPLVYSREGLFKDFAVKAKLPIITDNCPACFSAPKERHRIKIMLSQQENLFPGLYQSILKTMMPLMRSNMKDILGAGKGEDSEDEAQEDMLTIPKEGFQCPFDP